MIFATRSACPKAIKSPVCFKPVITAPLSNRCCELHLTAKRREIGTKPEPSVPNQEAPLALDQPRGQKWASWGSGGRAVLWRSAVSLT